MYKTVNEFFEEDDDVVGRLYVINTIAFINLLLALGFREDKPWGDDEKEMYDKICLLAKEHTKDILKEINCDKFKLNVRR